VTDSMQVAAPVAEGRILKLMFSIFEAQGLQYAILRNYETLPERVGARDVDILIPPEEIKKASAAIMYLAEKQGLLVAHHYCDERLLQFILVHRTGLNQLFDLKIDFFTSNQIYGLEVMSAREMLCNPLRHRGIPVVAEPVQLLDKFLFHVVVGHALHPKYNARFARIATQESGILFNALAPLTGKAEAEGMIGALSAGQGSDIPSLNFWQRMRVLGRLWRRQRAGGVLQMTRFLYERLRNHLRPAGLFVSISGPDGSGKTTVIELVLPHLRQLYGSDNVAYYHFRPTVLPRIAEVARAAKALDQVDEDYARPHRAEPSGIIGSAGRLSYYLLDYILGYFRRVYPELVDRKVILFDRYYQDMIADPGRSRIRMPTSILRLAARLLPLPRFSFFIRVDPEEVHRRKQELSLDEISELNARYDDLATRGFLIPIDNDVAPEVAAAKIVDFIIEHGDRSARRLLARRGI